MSTTTDTLRDQGFLPVQSDIPQELTLAEYRARRGRLFARVSRRPRLLRRRERRPGSAA
jgi:hypothetical protein